MDGVPGVTQRALQPRTSQLYDFLCPTAGAFWYHSHFKEQYIDGATPGSTPLRLKRFAALGSALSQPSGDQQPGRWLQGACGLQPWTPPHAALTPGLPGAGMKGALIVHDPSMPRFPVETNVQLSDWWGRGGAGRAPVHCSCPPV